VNLGDIQVCSGNGAWGDDPDTADTWRRVRPLWDILDSIDWDHLVDARPWYAQELVSGEGFHAGTYVEPGRAIVFLANRGEAPGTFAVRIDPFASRTIRLSSMARMIAPRSSRTTLRISRVTGSSSSGSGRVRSAARHGWS